MRLLLASFLALLLLAEETRWVGSRSCRACHQAIYNSYMRTPMAVSSGVAGSGNGLTLQSSDMSDRVIDTVSIVTAETIGYRFRGAMSRLCGVSWSSLGDRGQSQEVICCGWMGFSISRRLLITRSRIDEVCLRDTLAMTSRS